MYIATAYLKPIMAEFIVTGTEDCVAQMNLLKDLVLSYALKKEESSD